MVCDQPNHGGRLDAYVLVFIHLGIRKVYCRSSTYHPNSKWVTQQARNAAMWMEENKLLNITPVLLMAFINRASAPLSYRMRTLNVLSVCMVIGPLAFLVLAADR